MTFLDKFIDDTPTDSRDTNGSVDSTEGCHQYKQGPSNVGDRLKYEEIFTNRANDDMPQTSNMEEDN